MADNNGIMPTFEIGNGGGMSGGLMFIFGLVALLALISGGGGLFGNNAAANTAAALGYENLSTSQEVQNGFNAQNQQALGRDILGAVNNGTAQAIAASTANATNAINAIKDGNASIIREFGTVESALTALSGSQQKCCGELMRAVDSVNYNGAINTAAINANVTAQVQGLKDLLFQQRDQQQQERIRALELAQAMNGVLRFPQQWTFGAGPFPPIFGPAPAPQNI